MKTVATTEAAKPAHEYPPAKTYDGSGSLLLVIGIFAACLIPLLFLPRHWTPERLDEHNKK